MANIYDVLMSDKNVRIVCNDKKLIWNGLSYELIERKNGSQKLTMWGNFDTLEEALDILIWGE